jgi:hypothetical protein
MQVEKRNARKKAETKILPTHLAITISCGSCARQALKRAE